MRSRAFRRDAPLSLAPCALLLLLDCGIARGPKPEVDSESHFLGCTSETDCGGIAGATCAGGWCVDVETGERIHPNALGNENWDALPSAAPADDFPAASASVPDPAASVDEGSVVAGIDPPPPPPLPCYTSSLLPAPAFDNQEALNRLAGCENIYGDLEITFDANLQALHSLRSLFGNLYIHPASGSLTSLAGLENLELVSGDLHLANLGVSSLERLARLQAVGANEGQGLILEQSPGLRNLQGLEQLQSLHGLSLIGLPNLVSMDGYFVPQESSPGTILLKDVPALASFTSFIADSVTVDNAGFTDLQALQWPVGKLTLRNNALLVEATVTYAGRITIENNPRLATVSVAATVKPLLSLDVVGNASLQSIVADQSLSDLDSLSVRENPALQTISLPWVQSLNTFQLLRNTNLTTIELPLLVQQVSDLMVVSNPNLAMPSIFSITGRARKYKLAGNQGDPLFLDPCPYIRDTFCDAPPVDSICAPGTDNYDCTGKP